ncbi:MAG: hypothetical protein NT092_12390 [Bacteroidia bacterium]|nr:hypothetical protein [Bacteroidia bacterium]
MRRSLIIVIVLLFNSGYLTGQQPFDTLYLKNGDIVCGTLLKSQDNIFSMKTPDGCIFNINKDDVDRFISKAAYKPGAASKANDKKSSPLSFIIQSGMSFGSAGPSAGPALMLWSITPMLCYEKKPGGYISIGSGAEQFTGIMIPVFLDLKVNFLKKDVTPFFYIKTGIIFSTTSDEKWSNHSRTVKDGWTFGLGLGYSWPMSGIESFVRIGYRHTQYAIVTKSFNNVDREMNNFNRVEMTWGFKF